MGIAGVIPFLATTGGAIFAQPKLADMATFGLLTYGAVILSFLGGVLWGSVVSRRQLDIETGTTRLLIVSVVPSLIGWVAVLLGPDIGLPIMALSFLLVLAADITNTRSRILPPWYPKLRIPLTTAVVALLLSAVML